MRIAICFDDLYCTALVDNTRIRIGTSMLNHKDRWMLLPTGNLSRLYNYEKSLIRNNKVENGTNIVTIRKAMSLSDIEKLEYFSIMWQAIESKIDCSQSANEGHASEIKYDVCLPSIVLYPDKLNNDAINDFNDQEEAKLSSQYDTHSLLYDKSYKQSITSIMQMASKASGMKKAFVHWGYEVTAKNRINNDEVLREKISEEQSDYQGIMVIECHSDGFVLNAVSVSQELEVTFNRPSMLIDFSIQEWIDATVQNNALMNKLTKQQRRLFIDRFIVMHGSDDVVNCDNWSEYGLDIDDMSLSLANILANKVYGKAESDWIANITNRPEIPNQNYIKFCSNFGVISRNAADNITQDGEGSVFRVRGLHFTGTISAHPVLNKVLRNAFSLIFCNQSHNEKPSDLITNIENDAINNSVIDEYATIALRENVDHVDNVKMCEFGSNEQKSTPNTIRPIIENLPIVDNREQSVNLKTNLMCDDEATEINVQFDLQEHQLKRPINVEVKLDYTDRLIVSTSLDNSPCYSSRLEGLDKNLICEETDHGVLTIYNNSRHKDLCYVMDRITSYEVKDKPWVFIDNNITS